MIVQQSILFDKISTQFTSFFNYALISFFPSEFLFPYKLTVSRTNKAVHKYFFQTFFHHLPCHTLFQYHLKKAAATGTTYQLSVYQFLNTAENLLNQSVTATYMIL